MIRSAKHRTADLSPLSALVDEQWSDEAMAALAGVGDTLSDGLDQHGPVARALWEQALFGPVRDMLARPSKQLRGDMVSLGWRLAGRGDPAPAALIQVVEIIHAGSLVIDDIQDDSSQRRGAACLHRLYGVPLSINTGNWMYFWALELVDGLGLGSHVENELRRIIGRAMFRCHFGQALDLSIQVGRIPQRWLPSVVATSTGLKTGALMELAALLGAVAAGASKERSDVLACFGRRLGIGLQMLDDLANLAPPVADNAPAAKRYEDLRLGRPTWPWAWAAEELDEIPFVALQADARVVHAQAQAHHAPRPRLEQPGVPGAGESADGESADGPRAVEALAAALREVVAMRGRRSVRSYLELAVSDLEVAMGPLPELALVTAAVERLEASFGQRP